MGKASRQQNRELAAQAALAQDLNALRTRPLLLAGVQVDTMQIVTQYGPTVGVQITFHTQDGKQHGPILLDLINGMVVLNAITHTFTQAMTQGPPAPEPPGDPADPSTIPTEVAPSGLIIPT